MHSLCINFNIFANSSALKMWQTIISFLDCDLKIDIPGTDLISPNYPSSYLGNLDCTYLIKFEEGKRIKQT